MNLFKSLKAKAVAGFGLFTGYVATSSASVVDPAVLATHMTELQADVSTVGSYVIGVILMLTAYGIIYTMIKRK